MPGATPSGLYVHFPYCVRKCVYCDFNSYATDPPRGPYLEAVLSEIGLRAPSFAGTRFDTIFFGGGTPSLWGPGYLKRVVDSAKGILKLDPVAEVTVEANPGTVDQAGLEDCLAAGVNRVSVGVQSLVDGELMFLGRIHDATGAVRTLRAARAAGFGNLSADLIFGIPGQTPATLLDTVARVVSEGVRHISLYALTLAAGTPLSRMVKAGLELPGEEDTAQMYVEARKMLAGEGFVHYEISNWARPGFECRHNLHCWEGGYYLGAGAGAHGHHPGIRYSNDGNPASYMEMLGKGALPAGEVETIDMRARGLELVCLGLRMMKGFDPAAAGALMGEDAYLRMRRAAAGLAEAGLLTTTAGRYALTENGELFADRITLELVS